MTITAAESTDLFTGARSGRSRWSESPLRSRARSAQLRVEGDRLSTSRSRSRCPQR